MYEWVSQNSEKKLDDELNYTMTEEQRNDRLRDHYFEEVWEKIEKQESKMTVDQKASLKEVLRRNKVFPVPGREFATKSQYVHCIELIPGAKPIYCTRNKRQSSKEREAIEKQIQEWLQTGVIVRSNSPWAAPVVLVPKKGTDKMRMCVNYQRLNNVTIKDRFLLPIIDDIMHSVGKASHFGTLDLANGFNQIPVAPVSSQDCIHMPHGPLRI